MSRSPGRRRGLEPRVRHIPLGRGEGHQVVEAVRDTRASLPGERPGWRMVVQLLESADGVVVYALDGEARSLWDLAAVVKELEGHGKILLSVRERLDRRVIDLLRRVREEIRQLGGIGYRTALRCLSWAPEARA